MSRGKHSARASAKQERAEHDQIEALRAECARLHAEMDAATVPSRSEEEIRLGNLVGHLRIELQEAELANTKAQRRLREVTNDLDVLAGSYAKSLKADDGHADHADGHAATMEAFVVLAKYGFDAGGNRSLKRVHKGNNLGFANTSNEYLKSHGRVDV